MNSNLALIMAGQAQQGSDSVGSTLNMLVPFLVIFVIFYVLIIRPQSKQRRKHQEILESLKSGDRIVTAGGIYGTIHSVTEETVQVKVGEKVKVTVLRSSVRGLQGSDIADLNE
ncbi:preprotein translocase subunit YajC [bacterium]|nr:preprotein translocase subunit YajC [bacterium]